MIKAIVLSIALATSLEGSTADPCRRVSFSRIPADELRPEQRRLRHDLPGSRASLAFVGAHPNSLASTSQHLGPSLDVARARARDPATSAPVGAWQLAGRAYVHGRRTRVGALAQDLGVRGAVGKGTTTGELILKEVKQVEGVDVNIMLEGLGGNRRRISGGLFIEAPPRAIWDVLTNYNALNEYIPNIAESGAVLQPNGKIRIEQVGVISPTLKITTRIVLEVTEAPYKTLTFSKVESREFIEFEGTYSIIQTSDDRSYLEYSVEALPLPILPIQLVQGKIKKEVPPMLAAVRTNANKYHALRCSTLGENWMEDVPVPVSTSYKKRIGSSRTNGYHEFWYEALTSVLWQDPLSDDRPRYRPAREDDISSYTLPGSASPSLPFSSIAAGLLQALIGAFKLLPGFKGLPGDD